MQIRGKIFVQFLGSWLLMPIALLAAQISEIAQSTDFIAAILVITSIAPIQVYLNEVFVPIAVRYGEGLSVRHGFEIAAAITALCGWLAKQLGLMAIDSLLLILLAQGYVWFSYLSSRRILEYQANSVIGAQKSFIVGSVIPATFLAFVLLYWICVPPEAGDYHIIFLLVLLPNAIQYAYVRVGWSALNSKPEQNHGHGLLFPDRSIWGGYLLVVIAMAMLAQYWKVELASSAVGFSAICVYLISPFSSMWLIYSKSKFMVAENKTHLVRRFWFAPFLTLLTMMYIPKNSFLLFIFALLTQVMTFKFITDIRLKLLRLYSV